MSEHVHTCLRCVPDMVPDVAPGDPRYFDAHDDKGSRNLAPFLNGVETKGVRAVYLGSESWAWIYQPDADGHKHLCHGHREPCMAVVFGDIVLRRKDGTAVCP